MGGYYTLNEKIAHARTAAAAFAAGKHLAETLEAELIKLQTLIAGGNIGRAVKHQVSYARGLTAVAMNEARQAEAYARAAYPSREID